MKQRCNFKQAKESENDRNSEKRHDFNPPFVQLCMFLAGIFRTQLHGTKNRGSTSMAFSDPSPDRLLPKIVQVVEVDACQIKGATKWALHDKFAGYLSNTIF